MDAADVSTFGVGADLPETQWRSVLRQLVALGHVVSEGELQLFSREGLLLLNNVFLVTACFGVLLGTLYPLVIDAFALGKISVGTPYFNRMTIPLSLTLLFLMAVAPVLPWRRWVPEVAEASPGEGDYLTWRKAVPVEGVKRWFRAIVRPVTP